METVNVTVYWNENLIYKKLQMRISSAAIRSVGLGMFGTSEDAYKFLSRIKNTEARTWSRREDAPHHER